MKDTTNTTDTSTLQGLPLLDHPGLNKDTAFTQEERAKHGLIGLLPDAVEDLDRQFQRAMRQLAQKPSPIEEYIFLNGLYEYNETLFFKVVMSDPKRFLPIVYDPTVAEACTKFGHIYRRAQGMYLSIKHKGKVKEVLKNWPIKDVRFICASSGGRILGLGDIGTNGMGIPIGKLQLYTACAGVPPDGLLPLLIDIGTTNQPLRDDPLYLGLRQPPPSSDELDNFVDEFMDAVQEVFPGCCVHFEDWKGTDALRLLARYTTKYLCYNDDIQGTASVVIAGLVTALQIKGGKLKDQKILFFGAGSAGIGIGNMIVTAMTLEGLSKEDAQKQVSMFDVDGLLEPSRKDLNEWQKPYAHPHAPTKDLHEAVASLKPNILIGVSTVGGTFTQAVVEEMSKNNERPIIFALSNPTEKAECTAQQAYEWSDGKALFAAGVQFPEVNVHGKNFEPGQANNFYVFPAVAMAVYLTRPKRITDEMFIAAAHALAEQVSSVEREKGLLFPPQRDVFTVEVATAMKVARIIFEQKLATVEEPADLVAWTEAQVYKPAYKPIGHEALNQTR